MIKVCHSTARKTVLVEMTGEVGRSGALRAAAEVAAAIRRIGHGYTLFEVFRGACKFSERATEGMAALAKTCYDRGRIWRVVQMTLENGHDPGLRILHRTRWGRRVPETEVYSVGEALSLAAEEIKDNIEWAPCGGEKD